MPPTSPSNRPGDVAAALASLNDALQGARRARSRSPRRPLRAERTRAKLRHAETERMVAHPWRIARAVYPWRAASWPVPDRTRADVLDDCRSYLAAQRNLAGNPWSGDFNRIIALEQAEAALLIMDGDPCVAARDSPHAGSAACAFPPEDA